MTSALAWVRARSPSERAGLVAALAVAGYVGWDSALWDPRFQLLLHLLAIAAVGGLLLVVRRQARLPRTTVDVAVLALLAAYALGTASAMNHGMSLRAMASVVAYALMLPVALVAIRLRPTWVGVVASVPVLAFSIPTLAVLAWRRIEWFLADAPGMPPLRMAAEGTPFGSVAVPPFVIWPAWALAGLIESPRWRRRVRIGLVAVGVPLTILSGSRSAWLAIGAAALIGGLPWAWSRRERVWRAGRTPARRALVGIGTILAAGVVAVLVVPRLTAVTSLLYRVDLWRDTLAAWRTDPLLGIGPGFMPYARQAAAADFSFPVRQPHSHNLPLGVLGDAGVVGLAAAVLLVATLAWSAGPWRSRTGTGRAAATVLVGLGVGGLFEDLTFLPNFNLLAILLAAVALADAGAVRWATAPSRSAGLARPAAAVGGGVVAGILVAAMIVGDAGGLAHRMAQDAAADRRWGDAAGWLSRAEAIDPWHPATPKALAVAGALAGDDAAAVAAARRALDRNPGDGPTWTNLALLCLADGERGCAAEAAGRAVATAQLGGAELLNAALVLDALGEEEAADAAYLRSLLSQRLTGLVVDWPRDISVGAARVPEAFGLTGEINRILAWWSADEEIDADAVGHPAARALAHALRGERAAAEDWLAAAIERTPQEYVTWELAIVLGEHWGRDVDRERAVARVLRGRSLPSRVAASRPPPVTFDIASFRAIPADGYVPTAQRLWPDPPFPWILLEMLP